MSNQVATRQNTAVAAAGSYGNPFTQAGSGASVTNFVKFTGSTGNFTYGTNDDEIPHGTEMAADIMNSRWIWTFWWDGEVLDTRESRIFDNPMGFEAYPDDLPEDYSGDMSLKEIRAMQDDRSNQFMDGWAVQGAWNMREVGGEGREFTFKLNQGVALKAFQALLESYGRQFQMKGNLVPIVQIGANKYKAKAKNVGFRFAPVLKIVDWVSEEDLQSMAGDDPDDYADGGDEAPAPTPAPAAAPTAPAQATGTGRRATRGRGNF